MVIFRVFFCVCVFFFFIKFVYIYVAICDLVHDVAGIFHGLP